MSFSLPRTRLFAVAGLLFAWVCCANLAFGQSSRSMFAADSDSTYGVPVHPVSRTRTDRLGDTRHLGRLDRNSAPAYNPIDEYRPDRYTPRPERRNPSWPDSHLSRDDDRLSAPVLRRERPRYEDRSRTEPTRYRLPDNNLRSTPNFPSAPDYRALPSTPSDSPFYSPIGNTTPAATPAPQSRPADSTQEELDRQRLKISYRYSHPTVRRFLSSLSGSQAVLLYRECADLIDARHISPKSYDERVRQGILNLTLAVERPEFASATGLRVDANRIRQYQQTIAALGRSRSIRSRSEAEQMLQTAMQLTGQHLGINPNVAALEFLYGQAESLDKYSAFEPKADKSASIEPVSQSATLDDTIVGIGVEIKLEGDGVKIIKVLPDGPALRGGLKDGDVIRSINGRDVRGMNLNAVVDLITGPIGSSVRVGVTRSGSSVQTVTLTRSSVKVRTVTDVKLVDPSRGVGYFRLAKFGKSSSQEVDEAMWSLHRQGMQSIVIDMRGNPGGLLTTAIDLCNKFLPCGTIVSTRGRNASDNSQETADYQKTWKVPVTVLVDGDSASASEIFAAAIQDNRRGIVVGSNSYGKGTVQTHFPLRSLPGTLRLTTAKFYSPSGREMAGQGVRPDITVADVSADRFGSQSDTVLARAIDTANSRQAQELALAAARCKVQGN